MATLKWQKMTIKQQNAARRFAESENAPTVSQCAKYLNQIFAYKRGEMSAEKFREETGYAPAKDWR